jgi:hypothetical protein
MIIHNVKHKLEFKKRDFWVGFYWEKRRKMRMGLDTDVVWHLWICVIPTLPLHISWMIIREKEND